MDSVVISVRVKKDTKALLERSGIDVEQYVKDSLVQRAARIGLQRKVKELKVLVEKNVKASKKGFAVESVREDRHAAH